MNADALAHFLRGLFRDEITEEHALVASMKEVDLAPFQDELDAATSKHTVTFARASLVNRIIARQTGSIPVMPTADMLLLEHPRRRGLFIAGTLTALVAGGALAAWLTKPPPGPQRLPLSTTAAQGAAPNAPASGQNLQPPAKPPPHGPVVTPLGAPHGPVVTPLGLPPSEPAPTARAPVVRGKNTKVRGGKVVRSLPPAVHAPTPAPAAKQHTPEQVQAKFRTVKGEYAAFKSQYGSVLEDRWNAIASEITFGKADKFDKLDAMLDSLRHDMTRVRSGGE
jgi:hypothetical protein